MHRVPIISCCHRFLLCRNIGFLYVLNIARYRPGVNTICKSFLIYVITSRVVAMTGAIRGTVHRSQTRLMPGVCSINLLDEVGSSVNVTPALGKDKRYQVFAGNGVVADDFWTTLDS